MPTLASYATLVGVRLLATKNIGAPHQRNRGTIVGVQSLSSRFLNQARREQHEQGSNPRLRRADQRTGKVTGNAKLETEGKTQKTAGKIQNAVGGFKDAVKEAVND